MLPAWIGDVIGTLHIHRISQKELAAEIGVHDKYLCTVLSGKKACPADMESRCRSALERLIQKKGM